jgi:hypothetical protein
VPQYSTNGFWFNQSFWSMVIQEPSAHLTLAFDFNDTPMLKRERLDQGLARSVTHLDPASSAM